MTPVTARNARGVLSTLRRFPAITYIGLVLAVAAILIGIVGPSIAPYPIEKMHVDAILQGPSQQHLLGTDRLGRDVFSRLLAGSRVSISVGLLATLLAGVIGIALGLVAGFYGKWVDEVVMRVMDMLMAFPYIVLAMALVAVIGPGLSNIVLVIGIVRLPQFARLTRGAVLAVKELEFITAARSVGATSFRVVLRHVFPNVLAPIFVISSLSIATAINTEAALSFLGLGITPPMSSWGTMLADGRSNLRDAWWVATFPGIVISLASLGFNLLGDAVQDLLDPRIAKRTGR
ncbi:MAG: ABC transporter permease [Trueperaceae bacterium]|nr:ABC transporter permease [Trueperaceae bacterium]